MKLTHFTKAFFLFCTLSASSTTYAQCTISTSISDTTIECGTSLQISANGFAAGPAIFGEDFNSSSLGPGWLTTPSLVYTNPCGPSLDGTPSGWFGNIPAPRNLTTMGLDVSCGAQICFDLDFAADDPCGCSDCEDPDLPNEGVFFQYSIDGGATWVDIYYFDPTPLYGAGTNPVYSWANYCFTLPPAALTTNTMLRWEQPAVTTSINDHWGLDNISVNSAGCNYFYDWAHIPGNPDVATQNVTPGDTTTYYVTYTDGTSSCQDSVVVNVTPWEIDIVGTPNPIGCDSCADLSVEFIEGVDGGVVDDFDPGISPFAWSDIQGGTPSTICGGGATGNALYFDGVSADRYAQTVAIDATICGDINFCLYMGNTVSGGSASGCENNETGDDVVLEYSIDNGVTFTTIANYSQGLWDGANFQQCFTESIPVAAQTTSTIFRWRQVAFFGAMGSDNWSLDDVEIGCFPASTSYSWITGTVSDPSSPTPEACPSADELYTVTVTNSATGCSATDTTTLFVDECYCYIVQFDGVATEQPSATVDVSGSFEYAYSPTTGSLVVEATNGTGTYFQTFNMPFTNNQVYTYAIPGVMNDGSPIVMDVYFTDSVSCSQTFTIDPPTTCAFELFNGQAVAQSAGIVDIEGFYYHVFSPSTGSLVISAVNSTGTYTETINAPFTDNQVMNYTISGVQDDSSDIILDIYFTDSLGCSNTLNLSTVSIELLEGDENFCIVAPNPVSKVSELAFNNDQQEELTITIVNELGQIVHEVKSIEKSIPIEGRRLKQGTYFYVITTADRREKCSGKFAVVY